MKSRNSNYNFGKLLLINNYDKKNKIEIKRLAKSTVANEIEATRQAPDEHKALFRVLDNAFRLILEDDITGGYRIYQVDENALSLMYSLKPDFIRAIKIDKSDFELLELACTIIHRVDMAKGNYSFMLSTHKHILEEVKDSEFSKFGLDMSLAEQHFNSYGEEIKTSAFEKIKSLLSNKW